jgi:hypothetical protein
MKKELIKFFIALGLMVILSILCYVNFFSSPYITGVEITESKRFVDQVIFNIDIKTNMLKLNKDVWCLVSEEKNMPTVIDDRWVKAENGYCSYTIENGNYNIFVKDAYGNMNDLYSQKVEINKILEAKVSKSVLYLYKGQSEKVSYELVTLGKVEDNTRLLSNDDSIVTVSNDIITGKDYGATIVKVVDDNGSYGLIQVYVSPFIRKPEIDTGKPYISCKQFSKEDADLIDKMLLDRIEQAGYQTRAGVVAAARFATLEFSYRIHYFYENGRLNNYAPYHHVDGEGRYYHRGMYLNESKFNELDPNGTFVGPATWGCDLLNFTDWGPWVSGKYYPNGLDCSGFTTWALYNGGFDIGDIGAGVEQGHYALTDIGEKVDLTDDLMSSGRVKVGDLIGLNGHMAILAGWDSENYYIAESLNTTKGVVMTVVPRSKLVHNSIYKYVVLMDSVYKNDGNLTNYWA